MSKVRVGLAGIGNCAAAFVVGCAWYAGRRGDGLLQGRSGLLTDEIGPYGPGDVEVVAAFDVDEMKVGHRLSSAIFSGANVYLEPDWFRRFFDGAASQDPIVMPGPVLDGVGTSLSELIPHISGDSFSSSARDLVIETLRDSRADVLVSYMPVGSDEATEAYAEIALEAGVAFVNAVPVFLARKPEWDMRFLDAGLPLIGDDVKGQLGATVLHRALAGLFSERGVWLDRTSQQNFGGETGDFVNMKDEERLGSKRESKTVAVTSVANGGEGLPDDCVTIGPSGIMPWLGDDKLALIDLYGTGFAGNEIKVEVRYQGGDSPNSAAVIYDAVRHAKVAKDAGVGGTLQLASGYLMKAPPSQLDDARAHMNATRVAESMPPLVR